MMMSETRQRELVFKNWRSEGNCLKRDEGNWHLKIGVRKESFSITLRREYLLKRATVCVAVHRAQDPNPLDECECFRTFVG